MKKPASYKALLVGAFLVFFGLVKASDSKFDSDNDIQRYPQKSNEKLELPNYQNELFLNDDNNQNLDCCERCYVGHERACFQFCFRLRSFCQMLSCGAASNESCGVCTCCDFTEGSTRGKALKRVKKKQPPFLVSIEIKEGGQVSQV